MIPDLAFERREEMTFVDSAMFLDESGNFGEDRLILAIKYVQRKERIGSKGARRKVDRLPIERRDDRRKCRRRKIRGAETKICLLSKEVVIRVVVL